MSVRLHLDPAAIAAAGSTLAGVAQRMAADVAELESTVAGPGNPWGDDESGSAFAVAYQAVLGHALGALGSYVQQMGDAALSLTLQARAVESADAEAAASLRSAPALPFGAAPAPLSAESAAPSAAPASLSAAPPDGFGAGT
ncbi:hypothetical protein [Actinoplanes sp. DH11]|uniref:hypothetical protein n=1 Tax=Actinoplanes sp. DH11 TaxID=2857011 RepID=UPI001E28D598|nr:hypothetical protein [Actinoplanes sp. DH11]